MDVFTRTRKPRPAHVIIDLDPTDDACHGQQQNVPERPIGELKNGLALDRLRSHRFLANAPKRLCHVLAYLLWSLFREANSQVPELAKLEVGTARARLFKVGALVQSTTPTWRATGLATRYTLKRPPR